MNQSDVSRWETLLDPKDFLGGAVGGVPINEDKLRASAHNRGASHRAGDRSPFIPARNDNGAGQTPLPSPAWEGTGPGHDELDQAELADERQLRDASVDQGGEDGKVLGKQEKMGLCRGSSCL